MILEVLGIGFGLAFFIALVTIGWGIGKYNSFISGVQNIKTQFSNVKTEYQRRADLFYNLMVSVKSYKKHEKEAFSEITKARNPNYWTGSIPANMKKMEGLNALFSRLMMVQENYPNLKADAQHNKLMDEVKETEDRINVGRTDYNDVVREYNIDVKTFPSNIIANMFQFKTYDYYMNEQHTNKAPKMEL